MEPLQRKKRGRGRPPGSRNRATKNLQEMIKKFLEENFDEVKFCFEAIQSPAKRAKVYIDLLQFVVPKQSASSIEATISRAVEDDEFKKFTDQLMKANNARLEQLQQLSIDQQKLPVQLPENREGKKANDEGYTDWEAVN